MKKLSVLLIVLISILSLVGCATQPLQPATLPGVASLAPNATASATVDSAPDLANVQSVLDATLADLDGARTAAQNAKDAAGFNCFNDWYNLLSGVQGLPKLEAGPHVFSNLETARIIHMRFAGGIPQKVKDDCAPLVMQGEEVAVRLGLAPLLVKFGFPLAAAKGLVAVPGPP
jgi:hypothetical protein